MRTARGAAGAAARAVDAGAGEERCGQFLGEIERIGEVLLAIAFLFSEDLLIDQMGSFLCSLNSRQVALLHQAAGVYRS